MAKTKSKKELSFDQQEDLIKTLKARFTKNMDRHKGIAWEKVEAKLVKSSSSLWSLYQMEITGGEPDIIGLDKKSGEYIFCDCSPESPKGRRSLCYDKEAQKSRKENAPDGNALEMAEEIGIEILTEEDYRTLQKYGPFDEKTSSWLKTPDAIRKLGGAIFGDYRYGQVFVYHNGAQSYYAARGFRGLLRI